ncbi:MAG: 5-formyltetrahydrofolate cyclo-ligase [Planctomycetota bacterium]
MDKQELRKRCWQALQDAGAARFPGTLGRIPNFVGAERAAERLAATPELQRAQVVKCNPDSPQRPLRHRLLKAGKTIFLAVPRLAEARPFWELDPSRLPEGSLWEASSIKGAAGLGRAVSLEEMPPIDLIVTGCVGVDRRGARLGKGGGFSDLEFALLRETGKVEADTIVATLVHESQVLLAGTIPMQSHDQSLDIIATPERLIRCDRRFERPGGILWDRLDPAKRSEIPVLRNGGPGRSGKNIDAEK